MRRSKHPEAFKSPAAAGAAKKTKKKSVLLLGEDPAFLNWNIKRTKV